MARKTDSPNTRRNHFLHRASKDDPKSMARLMPGESFFQYAFSLDPDANDISSKAVRKAFETFKLDPADPFHWRLLIDRLAYMQFGERPKKKRDDPKKWTATKTEALRSEIRPHSKLSIKRTALLLNKDKKSAFFDFGVSGLEKKIGEIRREE